MAKQDIAMDATLGELATSAGLAGKVFYDFRLTDETAGEQLCGEITVPADFTVRYTDGQSLRIRIPYTPLYRELKVRLLLDGGDGHIQYLTNPVDNTIWFPVCREDPGGQPAAIRLSEFGTVDGDGNFNLVRRPGYLVLFSAKETDVEMRPAKYQNEVFLLKASPGNLYQHPTTGVGLVEFLHGNFENNSLAARLQSEFKADNMIIKNAYMDSLTGELLLETEEKEAANG